MDMTTMTLELVAEEDRMREGFIVLILVQGYAFRERTRTHQGMIAILIEHECFLKRKTLFVYALLSWKTSWPSREQIVVRDLVKGTDVESYSQRFQELALMYSRMFLEESDEVEKYVGGLLDMIQGSVMASKPKKMHDANEFATELMDQKIRTLAERQAENKRKFEDTSRNNQNWQQYFKRHNVACAYYMAWGKETRTGHLTRDCRSQPAATNNQRAQGENQRIFTCFEYGAQGHFKSNCPKLKNKNQGNQAGNGNAVARAYSVGTAGTNPKSNVVMRTFLLNNHYALILFDTGADRIFVSTTFSSLIDITPTTLDRGYDVELADG
ncbi:putative reverse transcriptase domain-containing protein [Tanacetum coccineum]